MLSSLSIDESFKLSLYKLKDVLDSTKYNKVSTWNLGINSNFKKVIKTYDEKSK